MHSRSKRLTIILILLLLLSAGLYLLRIRFIDKKVEETVVSRVEALFGDSVQFTSLTSSILLQQVVLHRVTIRDRLPQVPFLTQGSIERLVIKVGTNGVRNIRLERADLSLAIREISSPPKRSEAPPGTSSEPADVPSLSLSKCRFTIKDEALKEQTLSGVYPDLVLEAVSGRIHVGKQSLAVQLKATAGTHDANKATVSLTMERETGDLELSFSVKDITAEPFKPYLPFVRQFTCPLRGCTAKGTVARRRGAWESKGETVLEDVCIHLGEKAALRSLSATVSFTTGSRNTFECKDLIGTVNTTPISIPRATMDQLEGEVTLASCGPVTMVTPARIRFTLAQPGPAFSIAGTAEGTNIDFGSTQVHDLSCVFSFDREHFRLLEGTAGWMNGTVRFNGETTFTDERPFSVTGAGDDINLVEISSFPLPAEWTPVSARCNLTGSFNRLSACSLSLNCSTPHVRGSLNGTADLTTLSVLPGTSFEFENFQPSHLLQTLSPEDGLPEFLDEAAETHWSGHGNITGPFMSPTLSVTGRSQPVSLGPFRLATLNVTLESSPSSISLNSLSLREASGGELTFEGTISRDRVNGSFHGDNILLHPRQGMSATALIEGTVSGTPAAPELKSTINLSAMYCQGIRIGNLDLDIQFADSKFSFHPPDGAGASGEKTGWLKGDVYVGENHLKVDELEVKLKERILHFSAVIPRGGLGDDSHPEIKLWMKPGPLSQFSELLPAVQNITGTGSVVITLDGAQENPRLNGSLILNDFSFTAGDQVFPPKSLNFRTTIVNNELELKAALSDTSFAVAGTGTVTLPELKTIAATMVLSLPASRIRLAELIHRTQSTPFDFDGHLEAKLDIQSVGSQVTVGGNLTVADAKINILPRKTTKSSSLFSPGEWLDLDITLAAGKQVALQGTHFRMEIGGEITAESQDGRVGLNGSLTVIRGIITYLNNRFQITSGRLKMARFKQTVRPFSLPGKEAFTLSSFAIGVPADDTSEIIVSGNATTFGITRSPHVLDSAGARSGAQHMTRQFVEIQVLAEAQVRNNTITMNLSGRNGEYQTAFSSVPQLTQEQILAVLTGRSIAPGELGGPDILGFVETGVTSSVLSGIGQSIGKTLNLDSVTITPTAGDSGFLTDPTIQVGKYLLDDLYAIYEQTSSGLGNRSLELEYRLNGNFTLDGAIQNKATEQDVRMGIKFRKPF